MLPPLFGKRSSAGSRMGSCRVLRSFMGQLGERLVKFLGVILGGNWEEILTSFPSLASAFKGWVLKDDK